MHSEIRPTVRFDPAAPVETSLSDSVRGLVGSEILKIAGDIRRRVAAGDTVCNLTVGDFDARYFPIPAGLRDRIVAAIGAGETNYPPSDGVQSLREAVVRYTEREWGSLYPVESVLIASGARPILYGAYRCVVNPGDRVVYPVPSWNNNHYVWMTGAEGVVVTTRAENGFMPTLDELAPHLHDARMVCLNSPLNPAGTVIEESALRAILEAVVEENRRRTKAGLRNLFLLHDQVYAALVFGEARHHLPVTVVPEAAPWIISLDGISKSLASTGLRVGWVLAAPPLVARMKNLIGHVGAWAPRPEQVGLAAFLDHPEELRAFQIEMNSRVQERLQALHEGFEALARDGYPVDCIAPQGAIYLSMRLDLRGRSLDGEALDTNEAVRKMLLTHAGIAVVPFQAFGLEEESGWFRLSIGAVSLDDIGEMFPRMRAVLDRLN